MLAKPLPLSEDVIYGWFPSTGKTVESLLLIAGGLAEGQGPDDIGPSQEGDHAQRQDRRRPRGGQVSRSFGRS